MKKTGEHTMSEAANFGGFDPARSEMDFNDISGGKRKIAVVESVQCIRWDWPSERKDQRQAFDDWHDIAMQILHRAKASFRLMAVYRRAFWWKQGCIWSSDEELARDAGNCNWKTISREVAMHKRLGIISVEKGWRVVGGLRLRTREIRLAIPLYLGPEIVVRDVKSLPVHTDTHGPYGNISHTDTRGPYHTDTRGPITLDTHERGASSNVST